MRFTTITTAGNWLPNIADLSERLLLGPQRTILGLIEQVNARYGLTLRATKTYRWSPGYKLQIKEWMAQDYLEPHMNRKISTYFNKIDEKQWKYDQFKRLLNDIDNKMATNRREGAVFQDNTGILEDKINIFKNRLESQLEEANNQFNAAHIHVNARILTNENGKDFFTIKVSLPPGKMNIFIGSTPYPIDIGGVDLWFTTGLDALVYSLCSHNSIVIENEAFRLSSFFNDSNRYGGYHGGIKYLGVYYPEYDCNNPNYTLSHPYISKRYHNVTMIDDNSSTYICLGQLLENVDTFLKNMDLVSLCATLMTWHSCFHAGRTHPLNGISQSFFGLPHNTTEFRNIASISSSLDCKHNYIHNDIELDEHDTGYCDDIDCFFKEDCEMYRTISKGVEQPENMVTDTSDMDDAIEDYRRIDHELDRAVEYQAAMEDTNRAVEAEMVRAEADAYNENNSEIDTTIETPEPEDLAPLPDIDLDVEMETRRMALEHERNMEAEAEIGREEYDRDGEPDVDEGYRRIQEDNETPEERVIRWAAENGGAINIGDRS